MSFPTLADLSACHEDPRPPRQWRLDTIEARIRRGFNMGSTDFVRLRPSEVDILTTAGYTVRGFPGGTYHISWHVPGTTDDEEE